MTTRTIWTIGHSTRPIDELIAMLQAHCIQRLVDVRTVPKSRHNPQFNTDALARSLAAAAIRYEHAAALGGLRKPKKDSLNGGWRNASFRGYADYMQTDEFQRALEALVASGADRRTAIMCAEAVPWRCHRSLVADALVSRSWTVKHIMSSTKTDDHRLTAFAAIENGRITYPCPDDAARLF